MTKPDPMVELKLVYEMNDLNEFKTALQFLRCPDGNFIVHLTCGVTGTLNMGFLTEQEVSRLAKALDDELNTSKHRN